MKNGLLLSPRFPSDSFWSYRYILHYVNAKAAFPPLGLLTFAALMPEDWSFELIDLNVTSPATKTLRRKVAEADAVFVGAMSIQKPSLVQLLQNCSGSETPWILGGPMASTYYNQMLEPKTESDRVLHDGLDLLVWGEAHNVIGELVQRLESRASHSVQKPDIIIPQKVKDAKGGSRAHLNDRSLFTPLDIPVPRWDLVNIRHYRNLMMQTTAGCKFRCDFCDIIQFNGGFPRVKKAEQIQRELRAIYDTGHRGGVFIVDDNIMSNTAELSALLDQQIGFQRTHDYPFTFGVQCSVDLMTESNRHLIQKFKMAGYDSMFFGIENPNPASLSCMNKKQNRRVDLNSLPKTMHGAGIDVYAGFIFGCDEDTPETANDIVRYIKQSGIFTAMTGLLTPLPNTPLYHQFEREGRLIQTEYTGNNFDDQIQYQPRNMSIDELKNGMRLILSSLFNSKEIYQRAFGMLESFNPHYYKNKHLRFNEWKAAVMSFLNQGVKRMDPNYFQLLAKAMRLDFVHRSEMNIRIEETQNRFRQWRKDCRDSIASVNEELIAWAEGHMVRFQDSQPLENIYERVNGWKQRVRDGLLTESEIQEIYSQALMYLKSNRKLFTFPGANLTKAFYLAIHGSHYERVVSHILAK